MQTVMTSLLSYVRLSQRRHLPAYSQALSVKTWPGAVPLNTSMSSLGCRPASFPSKTAWATSGT
jgi:hypothetical protein